MTKRKLKYPHMREELKEYLYELSSIEFQKKNWIKNDKNNFIHKSQFDYSVHFLYDDTDLSITPEKYIGIFLENQQEANLVYDVIKAIDIIFKKYGLELIDEEYIKSTEWSDVLKRATLAWEFLK